MRNNNPTDISLDWQTSNKKYLKRIISLYSDRLNDWQVKLVTKWSYISCDHIKT